MCKSELNNQKETLSPFYLAQWNMCLADQDEYFNKAVTASSDAVETTPSGRVLLDMREVATRTLEQYGSLLDRKFPVSVEMYL